MPSLPLPTSVSRTRQVFAELLELCEADVAAAVVKGKCTAEPRSFWLLLAPLGFRPMLGRSWTLALGARLSVQTTPASDGCRLTCKKPMAHA
jgi:hypothetical protein